MRCILLFGSRNIMGRFFGFVVFGVRVSCILVILLCRIYSLLKLLLCIKIRFMMIRFIIFFERIILIRILRFFLMCFVWFSCVGGIRVGKVYC